MIQGFVDRRKMIVMSIATRDSNNDCFLAVYVSLIIRQRSLKENNCTYFHEELFERRKSHILKINSQKLKQIDNILGKII